MSTSIYSLQYTISSSYLYSLFSFYPLLSHIKKRLVINGVYVVYIWCVYIQCIYGVYVVYIRCVTTIYT